jgi:predicted  nucleic acid-binding Zn-ribbon protein
MTSQPFRFNTPPNWPQPPQGWVPDPQWRPDPAWPPAPPGWNFWVPIEPAGTREATPTRTVEPASSRPPLGDDAGQQALNGITDKLATVTDELQRVQQELAAVQQQVSDERSELARLKAQDATAASATSPVDTTLAAEAAALTAAIETARQELVELNDAALLQQVGIYEYHHPLENADAYKERLTDLRTRIKDSVKAKDAILASDRFAYNNSLAQGRRMTADLSKLMLRAYNAEADNCVRSLRAGSIQAAVKRLDAAIESIARLGSLMEMRVAPNYHALRIEELQLTSDYLFKIQEEREAARDERERLREERKAEQELAVERERLDKERTHYANALAALQQQGKTEEAADLEARIAQIDTAIQANDFRAANIRAGYVYVISNIGAFGPNVVKIGMTRRLEPLDRVRELGDASVPFPFDVHAIYFSDDAVQLENELHAAFGERRLNQVNLRREFFFADPAQVRDVLRTKVGNLLEFTEAPEATQYFQSQGLWATASDG